MVWLTAAELDGKASAREYAISLRRHKRVEDFDRALQEHWELAVAHVASHGGADFRPTTQLNKAGARARRLQEGGNHPSRAARVATGLAGLTCSRLRSILNNTTRLALTRKRTRLRTMKRTKRNRPALPIHSLTHCLEVRKIVQIQD